MNDNKRRIGRTDKLDFPKLNLFNLSVKIDTGAYTSSIHCHKIEILEREKNSVLTCNLLDPEHPQYHDKQLMFNEFTKKEVKNSFGETEQRFVIKTEVAIFNELKTIELSLTDRGNMKFPVLIGRKMLAGFLVDVSLFDLSYKSKQANE